MSDEYETTIELFQELCEKYHIKPLIDVAAKFSNKKCNSYFFKPFGLTTEWKHDCWMNAPNSITQKFIKRASEQNKKYNINILSIMPINATVTKAGEKLIWNDPKVELYPLLPTPRFIHKGKLMKNARNRYCVVIWRSTK